MILIPIVLGMYDHDDISPIAQYNISMQIYMFATFIMFKVLIVYEILVHDESHETMEIEDEKYILILEHVIFLSGTLAEACLYQILMPYFGGFLFGIWILFLLKIACYWDKQVFDFDMFKNHQNNTNNTEEGRQEAV